MARPLRIDYPGAWHHVMNRGARRQTVYLDDGDHFRFLCLLGKIPDRYGVTINAYALMGNHYHLLLNSQRGEISRAMQYLDGTYAQAFNREHGVDGPLFRGRFRSRLIEKGDYLRQVLCYVHQNPVAAGLVSDAADYQWSSYADFLGPNTSRPGWLSMGGLEASGIRSPVELRRAMSKSYEVPPLDDDVPSRPIFGSYKFETQHTEVSRGAGRLGALTEPPSLGAILTAVCTVFDAGPELVRPGYRERSGARSAAVGLSQEIGGLTLSEIADAFGFSSDRSAGSAVHRFRCQQGQTIGAGRVAAVRRMLIGE